MTAFTAAGAKAHDDPIIESDPPHRLVYGWKPMYKDLPDERMSRVTFELEPFKDQTRFWSFKKVSNNKNKGTRIEGPVDGVDTSFVLPRGSVLTFFMK